MKNSCQEPRRLRTIGLSCALALGGAGAFYAHAAYPGERTGADHDVRHITVHYSDLNLTDPAGMTTLYGRLRAAARVVCSDGATREIHRMSAYQECFDRALQNSVDGIDNRALYVLHARGAKAG